MWGARSGYVSVIFVRIERCTEDLTFDFAPGATLSRGQHDVPCNGMNLLLFEHCLEGFGRETVRHFPLIP